MITHNERQFRLFDTHTHAFPDAIADRTMHLLGEKAGIPYFHDGSHAGLCDYEDRGGADRFLLLPISTKPSSTRTVNQWAANHIGGHMLAFGSIHPDQDDIEDELDRIADSGLLGLKLHPEYQQFFVDEPRCLPLYEGIFRRGLVLCLHMGVDLGYPPPLHATPQRLASVLDRFPEGRFIAAHMGGYQCEADSRRYLAGRRNLWMDTAYVTGQMPPSELADLARAHGTDRVLFATDAPWTRMDDALGAMFRAGFTDAELADILYNNAAALLNV